MNMPGGDGTGPDGMGGWCTLGFGGRARGCGRMFFGSRAHRRRLNAKDIGENLKNEERFLELRLEEIKKEIKELGGQK
jgi:hypothetical protein